MGQSNRETLFLQWEEAVMACGRNHGTLGNLKDWCSWKPRGWGDERWGDGLTEGARQGQKNVRS